MVRGTAAALEFEALIWEKIAFDGAKPEAPHIRNLRWDQRIAFNIGWPMRGRPLWLVTDDRAFATVAKAVGRGDRLGGNEQLLIPREGELTSNGVESCQAQAGSSIVMFSMGARPNDREGPAHPCPR